MKAKDLIAKDIDDSSDPKENQDSAEKDQVTEAYENISKKLESIRSGKNPEEEEEEKSDESDEAAKEPDDDLEEWRRPKGVKSEEFEENGEESEIRKVSLKNVNNNEESETVKEVIDDPLDDESAQDEEEEGDKDEDEEDDEKKPSFTKPSEVEKKPFESEKLPHESAQPDTLDDLTQTESEDEYFIPNLKPSGQRSNIGYNAPIENEIQQRGSMENMQSTSTGNDPNNYFSPHQPQAPKRANKFHLLILVVIGVAVIGFTVYILKGGFGDINLSSQPSPSPSPVESPSPTPTPTPEPERSKYKVRILNGSGRTGLAKTVSDKLKELGYQIDKTGNATNSAFTQTVVRVKTEAEAFIPQVVKDLAPEFDAGGFPSLKDSETVDIEIILGAK